jgi:hypothetical protein
LRSFRPASLRDRMIGLADHGGGRAQARRRLACRGARWRRIPLGQGGGVRARIRAATSTEVPPRGRGRTRSQRRRCRRPVEPACWIDPSRLPGRSLWRRHAGHEQKRGTRGATTRTGP